MVVGGRQKGVHGIGFREAQIVAATHVHKDGRTSFHCFEDAPGRPEGPKREPEAQRGSGYKDVALLEIALEIRDGQSPSSFDDLGRLSLDVGGDEARIDEKEPDEGLDQVFHSLDEEEAVGVDVAPKPSREAQGLRHLGAEHPLSGLPNPLDEGGLEELVTQAAAGGEINNHFLPLDFEP